MNKQYILKANHEIEELLKKKNSVGSKYYVVYFDKYDGDAKIAVSCSKKLGDAYMRNYQKRTTKEILRGYLPELRGIKMLVVLKQATLDLSFDEKDKQLRYVLNKITKIQK